MPPICTVAYVFQSPFRYLLSQTPCTVSFIISRGRRRDRWRIWPKLGLKPRILETESSYYNNSKHICSARDCPLGFIGVNSFNPHCHCHPHFTDEDLFQSSSHGSSRLRNLRFSWLPLSCWPYLSTHFLRMPSSLRRFFSDGLLELFHSFTMHALVLQWTIRYALIFHHSSKIQFQSSIRIFFSPSELMLSCFSTVYLLNLFLRLHTLSLDAISPNSLKVVFIWILYS